MACGVAGPPMLRRAQPLRRARRIRLRGAMLWPGSARATRFGAIVMDRQAKAG